MFYLFKKNKNLLTIGKILNFTTLGPHGERSLLREEEVAARLLGVGFVS